MTFSYWTDGSRAFPLVEAFLDFHFLTRFVDQEVGTYGLVLSGWLCEASIQWFCFGLSELASRVNCESQFLTEMWSLASFH